MFDSKLSNESLTVPQSYFPELKFTFGFCPGEMKKLIVKPGAYGGAEHDSIFIFYFQNNHLFSSEDF